MHRICVCSLEGRSPGDLPAADCRFTARSCTSLLQSAATFPASNLNLRFFKPLGVGWHTTCIAGSNEISSRTILPLWFRILEKSHVTYDSNNQSRPPSLLDVILICVFSVCLFSLGPTLQAQFYGMGHSSTVEVLDELSDTSDSDSQTASRFVESAATR